MAQHFRQVGKNVIKSNNNNTKHKTKIWNLPYKDSSKLLQIKHVQG